MKNILKFFILALIIFNSNTVQAQNVSSQIDDEQAHNIVLNGTPDDVKMLLQSGYDVNRVYYCNNLLNSAIKSAAGGSQASRHPSYALEKIKILVESGADVNFVPCSDKSMSSLNWAVSLPAQVENTKLLINNVIDERIKNKIGECNIPTVVSKPCKDVTPIEREDIRKALHETYFVLNKYWTPYFMEIIKYLVNNGANINDNNQNAKKAAPLHLVTMNPEKVTLEPLKYLIENGADLNVRDVYGNTPLFWAYASSDNEVVKLLKDAGADVSIRNNDNVLFYEVSGKKMHSILSNDGNEMFEEL